MGQVPSLVDCIHVSAGIRRKSRDSPNPHSLHRELLLPGFRTNLVSSVVRSTSVLPLAMEVDIEDAMGISPVHFLAGAVAGTAEHCGMYPVDTIKVRAPSSLSLFFRFAIVNGIGSPWSVTCLPCYCTLR